MNGPNVGWWIPVLTVAVPLLLLLALHLLARLESWMFSSDDRGDRVARLLEEGGTPDEVEQEVQRLLAEVADPRAAAALGGLNRAEERGPGPGRVDRSFMQARSGRRLRLRRAIAGNASSEVSEQGPS